MRPIFLLILLLSCVTDSLQAAESRVQAETVLTYFDTPASSLYTTGNSVYTIQADVSSQSDPGLSLHINGKGQKTQTGGHRLDDISAAELELGYLEYQGDQARFKARLGRQYIHEALLVNVIDGMKVQSDLGRYFSVSLFSGQPANIYNADEQTAASTHGGRLTYFSRWHRFSLSYQQFESSGTIEETGGINLETTLPVGLSLTAQSRYDIARTSESSRDIRLSFARRWLSPLLHLFGKDGGKQGPAPLSIVAGNYPDYSYLGTELSLPTSTRTRLFLNVRNYNYVVEKNRSRYFSSSFQWKISLQGYLGAETGLMQSVNNDNRYQLIKLYGHWKPLYRSIPLDFLNSEMTLTNYPGKPASSSGSLFMSIGCGKAFQDDKWNLQFSSQYSHAETHKARYTGFLTLTFHYGRPT